MSRRSSTFGWAFATWLIGSLAAIVITVVFASAVHAAPRLASGGTPIPPPAAAVGYTIKAFETTNFNASNVDLAQTYASGFQWYYFNIPANNPNYAAVVTGSISGSVWNVTAVTSGTIAVGAPIYGAGIPGGVYVASLGTGTGGVGTYNLTSSLTIASETIKVGADVITLPGDGSMAVNGASGPNGNVVSMGRIAGSPYYVGHAWGGGFYAEATVSFNDALTDRADNRSPAYWFLSLEHETNQVADQWPGQAPGFAHNIEIDGFETFKNPRPQVSSHMIDWFGQYTGTTYPGGSCPGYCTVTWEFPNTAGVYPPGMDWQNAKHRFGVLWVPATGSPCSGTPVSGSGCGYLQYFIDDQPVSAPYSWAKCTGSTVTVPPVIGSSAGCILDSLHQVAIFGSGSTNEIVWKYTVWQNAAGVAADLSN